MLFIAVAKQKDIFMRKEGKCPYYQSKTCQFSADRCSLGSHKCFLCGGSHGAIDCNRLSSDDTKKKLGMS